MRRQDDFERHSGTQNAVRSPVELYFTFSKGLRVLDFDRRTADRAGDGENNHRKKAFNHQGKERLLQILSNAWEGLLLVPATLKCEHFQRPEDKFSFFNSWLQKAFKIQQKISRILIFLYQTIQCDWKGSFDICVYERTSRLIKFVFSRWLTT